MAILTVAELKASSEAIAAGVENVDDAVVQAAIDEALAEIEARLGYKIEDSATSYTVIAEGRSLLVIPARVRSLTTVESDGEVVNADYYELTGGDFHLRNLYGGWASRTSVELTGTFGFTSSDHEWKLAKRAIKLLAIARLQGGVGDFPMPPGAFLTGFSSEQASFQYFTPQSATGVPEVDRLINLIGPLRILA